jgi:hypothetical protein
LLVTILRIVLHDCHPYEHDENWKGMGSVVREKPRR